MALIQYNFKSQSVGRNVNVTVVLPTDGLSFYDPSEAEQYGHNPITKVIPHTYQPGMKFQTVYVYHGGGEDNSVSYRYAALERYKKFLEEHRGQHVLFLELGVGGNTPAIIKYPFWQMTAENSRAVYACVNFGEAFCPREIEERAVCINGDIGQTLERIVNQRKADRRRELKQIV